MLNYVGSDLNHKAKDNRMNVRSGCLIIYFLLQINLIFGVTGRYEYKLQAICRSSDLQTTWKKIIKLPEACRLIDKIQQEGAIVLISDNYHPLTKKFGAFWDPACRVITVNNSSDRLEGHLIASIIFELHNAYANQRLFNLDYLASFGIIDKETYIQRVEEIEYKNSLYASKLAQIGIEKGIFPDNAQLSTFSTFEEHYLVQKAGGHSSHIASNYTKLISDRMSQRGRLQNSRIGCYINYYKN